MKHSTLKVTAITLLSLTFIAPILGTFISGIMAGEISQYSTIQIIVMGVYNLPFVILSGIGLIVGSTLSRDRHPTAPKVWLIISILSSIVGTGLMLAWGLGLMS